MTVQLRSYFTALSGVGAVTEAVFDDLVASAAMLVEDKVVVGLASGRKIAAGVASITGSGDVVTGLATVIGAVVSIQDNITTAADRPQVTVGDQAGTPAAGSITIKVWKPTSSGNNTPIAAAGAVSVAWVAYGT